MVENPNFIAAAMGACRSTTGKDSPVAVDIIITKQGTEVKCIRLFSGGRCRTGDTCVWRENKEPKNQNQKLSIDTKSGLLVYDPSAREILQSPLLPAEHDPVTLTPIQGGILYQLCKRPGIPVGYNILYQSCWGNQAIPGYDPRKIVAIHTFFLRKRLGDNEKKLIKSVRGNGYRLNV